ncbi:hypothetical protein Trydic_g6176 [Trypoxylus dichotomus]
MEIENRNQLPFLDVIVIKKQDDAIRHTAYRKATHTNCYLDAQYTTILHSYKESNREQRDQTYTARQRFHHHHKQSLPYENKANVHHHLCNKSVSPLHKGYGQNIGYYGDTKSKPYSPPTEKLDKF